MRVVIADDHQIFREGVRLLLEREGFEVVGEAADGREAVALARRLAPRFAVLDLGMRVLNGIDAAREMRRRAPGTHVLLLTMFEDPQYVLEALRAGIRAYVLKAQTATELAQALREVNDGHFYLSPGIAKGVVEALLRHEPVASDPLTPQERQVLQLVAEGNSTKRIASILDVAVKTAESHRARIMQKLEARNVAGLVRHAVRQGLVRP